MTCRYHGLPLTLDLTGVEHCFLCRKTARTEDEREMRVQAQRADLLLTRAAEEAERTQGHDQQ